MKTKCEVSTSQSIVLLPLKSTLRKLLTFGTIKTAYLREGLHLNFKLIVSILEFINKSVDVNGYFLQDSSNIWAIQAFLDKEADEFDRELRNTITTKLVKQVAQTFP